MEKLKAKAVALFASVALAGAGETNAPSAGRYQLIHHDEILMRIDTSNGDTWMLEPRIGFTKTYNGQVVVHCWKRISESEQEVHAEIERIADKLDELYIRASVMQAAMKPLTEEEFLRRHPQPPEITEQARKASVRAWIERSERMPLDVFLKTNLVSQYQAITGIKAANPNNP